MARQLSLMEDARLGFEAAVHLSVASLQEYAARYEHWAISYSGGKDSSATASFVLWAIESGQVCRPKSLTVLYADTRMELPPLRETARGFLDQVSEAGYGAEIVLPPIERRFFVYMLGRGVPPPKNNFRWCTPMIKVQPMMAALGGLRLRTGEKLLMMTGVRLGESDIRDQRIALSCGRDDGECGQGWFQTATDESVADTLAPIVHWRKCFVYDWLYFDPMGHGYDMSGIAEVYGQSDVRTGCVGCNLAYRDRALERLLRQDGWERLRPLLELRPLYRELRKPQYRKRKVEPEVLKDGSYSKNVQRMGPLTMEARAYALETVLGIQARSGVNLINEEEEAAIRKMWTDDVWPRKWSREDAAANEAIDHVFVVNSGLVRQPLLV